MGQVTCGRGIKLKISLHNSGPRPAFVRATCRQLDDDAPLSDSHAHLKPSHLVVGAHGSEELVLFYQPDSAEEDRCRKGACPLARLVLESGDEVVRQRLVWEGKGAGLAARVSAPHREFVGEFAHQEKSASGEEAALQMRVWCHVSCLVLRAGPDSFPAGQRGQDILRPPHHHFSHAAGLPALPSETSQTGCQTWSAGRYQLDTPPPPS